MTFDWINMALSRVHHCNNRIWWLKWCLILVILQFLLLDTAFAQGKPPSRRWSVRKTGEFGRRLGGDNVQSGSSSSISTRLLSQELELPTRQFRLSTGAANSRSSGNLESAETRRYSTDAVVENSQFFRGAGDSPSNLEIRKPSLDLELPRFGGHRNFVADQEAQETEDNDVGYVYPKPDEGYNYEQPTPAPGIRPNEELEDPTTTAPDPPSPVEPDVIAGNPFVGFSPMKVETDESVDADSISNKKTAPPSSPQIQGIPSSEEHDKSACSGSDDDPACWPHGYGGVIPGTAGEDYPILSEIVKTDFSCDEQQFSGYYADADPQARCQIYHVCLKKNRYRKTQQWSFLCPNGTMFSQPDFVCVWWGDAPECSDTMVRSLYNLNEQLGWDNITEGSGSRQSTSVGELQGAMSAFKAKAAATPSSTRQSSALPYRVPVKVPEGSTGRARTKLQEVTQNGLHGQSHDLDYGEHDGEESSNFETSLHQQSESRTKTKSGSAFHKSISEGYELKGSADGVQPLIVNRPPPPSAPTDQPQYESQDVVMMPTLQRFPDGSEGYAEVPVMLPHHSTNPTTTQNPTHEEYREAEDTEIGYQYPNPTSTPAPTYLPPRRSTTPPRTTTEYFPPPTIPTEPPILASAENENYEQQQYPERFATTEQPEEGYRYPQPTTTEPQPEEQDVGYNYPDPNQSAQQQQQQQPTQQQDSEDGYRYPQPTTTEPQPALDEQGAEEEGYRYPNPTTTQRSSRFRQTIPTTTEVVTESTTTEEPYEEGYNYQAPTAGSQFESLRETTTEQQQDGYNYQRPNSPTTTENYNELIPTQQSADLVREEDQVSTTPVIPTTTEVELPVGGYLPPRSNDLAKQQLQGGDITAEEVDYEEDEEANEVVTDSSPAAGISDNDESGYSYNLPTPPSSATSANDIVLNGGALDSDEKLNEILKQIQSGGIEAVDSSGKPIEFSKLKELLLNSPRGSVELKGELDSVTSQSTEVSTTPFSEAGGQTIIPQQQTSEQPRQQSTPQQQPFYHTVTTAAILPNNPQNNNIFNTNSQRQTPTSIQGGTLSSPNGFYLPPNDNNNAINSQQPTFLPQQQQQQYYANNANQNVQYVDHPSYEIKLPNREFETHSIDLNSIAVDPTTQNRQFSQRQPQSGYYQTQSNQQSQGAPQQQFFQQQSPPGNYLPPPRPPQRQVQQPQTDYDRTNVLNTLVLPTPQQQRQQQQQPPSSSRPNGEYLPPRQATSSILQPQYYQQPSSPSRPFVSQPIQLTENIQLQQSFALPTQQPLFPTNGRNPLVDPKDIKIVPALFVHQHTSVASQDDNARGGSGLTASSGNIEDAFQNLDTAQSNYYTTATSGLASQLSQLTNLTPQSSSYTTGPRQFFRRSNNNNGGSSPSASSNAGASSSSHTIEKAHQVSTFTLEDARTPEELQKYHHQDLKRFHKDNIANQGSILDDAVVAVPPTTHATLPVIATIARQPQQSNSNRNGRKEGGGGSTTSTRFSVSSDNTGGGGRSNSNRDIVPSSHRNEEYFIPVSGSYGGGGGGGSSSSGRRTNSNNGSGGSIVRNSNSNTSNNDSNFSQFRVSGGHSSRGGGGGSSGPSSSYRFIDSERTLLSRFLPEREGGFGSRLFL